MSSLNSLDESVMTDVSNLPALKEAAARPRRKACHLPAPSPREAWQLVEQGLALLVDVRTAEERKFVGHVPGSAHVPWATGTALSRNPRFVRELTALLARRTQEGRPAECSPIALLLCRSGKRSTLAAQEAAKAGLAHVFNISEGFEGELDEAQHRGKGDGWRFHGLPWVQD